MRFDRTRVTAGLAVGALLGGLAVSLAAPTAAAAAAPAPAQAAVPNPDVALGSGWRNSTDTVVTGVGDTDGFHLYVARENSGFRWSTLATLVDPARDVGPWTGYTCVTGSGKYAVAVYEPAADDKPAQRQAGALAAVVNTATGAATLVASGVALEYFSPACGPGDTALVTRSIGDNEQQTDVLTIDAATATVTGTVRVNAQVTQPVPAADGDYGIAHGALVRIAPSGALSTVATPTGSPVTLLATGTGDLDLLTVNGNKSVVARITGGVSHEIGESGRTSLQLFGLRGGRDAVVGDVGALHGVPAGMAAIGSATPVTGVSEQGDLLVGDVVPQQDAELTTGGATLSDAGRTRFTVIAAHSGTSSTGTVTQTAAPRLALSTPHAKQPAAVRPQDTPNDSTPLCAIPRNNPQIMALQPTAAQINWAADEVVHGTLTVQRPANYLNAQQAAYTPQGMFPPAALTGGGTIPSQVLMGIFSQESNFREATWHARPGDGGNPLVANYYGAGAAQDSIDYASADCGYGIGQVTDGMQIGATTYTHAQQVAIATDYAANAAAAQRILASKWNSLAGANMLPNDGGASHVENWFEAAWAYNSGFHPNTGSGHYGLGWLNNPANLRYPANRADFLADGQGDASHPGSWPYEELVMGWAQYPQLTYFDQPSYPPPTFGSAANGKLTLPLDVNRFLFCTAGNSCNPSAASGTDPCPAEDSDCYFSAKVNWANGCANTCATEHLVYGAGAGEPAMVAQYPRDCALPSDAGAVIVDVIPDASVNVLGCPGITRQGKFTLRTGNNVGDYNGSEYQGPENSAYIAQIDLHQQGAGFHGFQYFTHTYSSATNSDGSEQSLNQKVVGTWTPFPNLVPPGKYTIKAYMPDHGGGADVDYVVIPGHGEGGTTYHVLQNTNGTVATWTTIATGIQLDADPEVKLANLTADGNGTVDIAYDAIEFIPVH